MRPHQHSGKNVNGSTLHDSQRNRKQSRLRNTHRRMENRHTDEGPLRCENHRGISSTPGLVREEHHRPRGRLSQAKGASGLGTAARIASGGRGGAGLKDPRDPPEG